MECCVLYLTLLFCIGLAPISRAQLQGTDQTRIASARGADVVRAVITLSRVLDSSAQEQVIEQFIREFAYVESRDGQDNTTAQPSGGIWRISSAVFEQTRQFIIDNPVHNDTIYRNFGTIWSDLLYMDLEIPLYSGLALRIYLLCLHQRNLVLTATATDAARAQYWITHFKNGAIQGDWMDRVNQLRELETCNVDTDVVFVLDSSGSIGADNYQIVRDYTYNFTESLISGGNTNSRVGIILYGCRANIRIPFNSNATELLADIERLPYHRAGCTNTPEGLCLLTEMPWREEISVLRIAIVLTDGRSNGGSVDCTNDNGDLGTVSSTARDVHDIDPPVLVFAIGVGNNYDTAELELIASRPALVDGLNSFHYTVLQQNIFFRSYFICFEETQETTVGEMQTGNSVNGGTTSVSIQSDNHAGVTYRICIDEGDIVIYISYSSPNPNSALNDDSIQLTSDGVNPCVTYYVPPGRLGDDNMSGGNSVNGRKRRQTNNGTQLVTIYITIVGTSETESHFSINSNYGNVIFDIDECANTTELCDENSMCHNTDGSYFCECNEGYGGNGTECTDIDECANRTDLCEENEVCNNTDGSYSCVECMEGYERNEQECIAVEEATVPESATPVTFIVVVAIIALLFSIVTVINVTVMIFAFYTKKLGCYQVKKPRLLRTYI